MANQISGKNENDVYSIGEQIRVTADPDTGYSFVQWETEDGEYIDSSNPYEQIVGEMTPPGVVNAKFKYNNLGEHFSTIKVEKPDPLLGSVTIMANDANDDPITV